MKRLFSLAALLFVAVLAFNGVAFGWGSTGGDASQSEMLQETAVFINNAGRTISVGDVVILDAGTSNQTVGRLGCNVTMNTGSADSILAIGVAKFNSSDGTPVIVCTKGPIATWAADSADAVTNATAVGTAGTSPGTKYGFCGGGTNLGIALESGNGYDNSTVVIWVDPTGAD